MSEPWTVTRMIPVLAATVAALTAAAAIAIAPAGAAFNQWTCGGLPHDTRCTDPDTTYHAWVETQSDSTPDYVPTLCTKSLTAAGNLRSTTAGNHCAHNTTLIGRCLAGGGSPYSRAYSYWADGTGSISRMVGTALSNSSSAC